jgi:thioesterase domain-containing protein
MSELQRAQAMLAEMRDVMPLIAFMQLEVAACDGRSLTLRAPLQPNRNDKGTAFAGAIASLSTVTGWALLMLWGRRHVGPCQVAVYHSEMRYRYPIVDAFEATATLPDEAVLQQLRDRMAARGKGRVDVQIQVLSAGQEAVTQTAGYALWVVPEADSGG